MNQIFSKIDIYCKIVHQVDRPDTIYKRPADIFVVTFIGSPAMNIFKGELFRENKRLISHNEEIPFDVGHIPSFFENSEVHADIRPEDINIGRDSDNIILCRGRNGQ
ncbi:MAG: hypothetical protein B1H11_01225 [Desulfobacteraceae bacterium 4484_190.1]|nr:MAG: hypothetical protein B1H11_01225 [Desulfobacteraceae bacterium 4484_190.1]